MFVIKPIEEPEIIDVLNKGRFQGEVQGYILSDGADLFGWSLFSLEKGITKVLDVLAPDMGVLDGLVRTSVSYGQERNCRFFSLNSDNPDLLEYKRVFFPDSDDIIPNEMLLKKNC